MKVIELLIIALLPIPVLAQENIVAPLALPDGAKPLELTWVEPGEFMMGYEEGNPNEGPVHKVTLTQGFYLGLYEVTNAQWLALMDNDPERDTSQPNLPVVNVTWFEANDYIARLNELGVGHFRLPTEAEWEYACRAGSATDYYFGINEEVCGRLCDQCPQLEEYEWFCGNSNNMPHNVGLLLPNPWGLFDMAGNVREWCADWYGSDYYEVSSEIDPKGPLESEFRVNRGSTYAAGPHALVSGNRNFLKPDDKWEQTGFRVVMQTAPSHVDGELYQ